MNATTFVAGSRILFKAGTSYSGSLTLRGLGTAAAPIVVDRYGAGALPRLTAGGNSSVLSLFNTEYWEINNLELTGGISGVFVHEQNFGVAHHLHFKSLWIHHISGGLTGDNGGFLLKNEGEDTYFDDLLVEGNTIEHADRNGILLTDYPKVSDLHHSTRVVIRGNQVRDIGGDGIFILGCDGAIIEHNVLSYAHQRVGRGPGERACAGLWPQRSNDTLIQHNEVSYTAVGGVTVWDSEGFDDDGSCRNTIFQYNYSHDNAGGFLLLCGGAQGTIVRYNISQNDGVATFSVENDRTGNATIYNNTIYVGDGMTVKLVRNTSGASDGLRFMNNLFYAAGTIDYRFGGITGVAFDHNLYFGNSPGRPADSSAIFVNPLLTKPGGGGNGMDTARAYKLLLGSPLRAAGTLVANNGGKDFFGQTVSLKSPPAIGAHNGVPDGLR